MEQYAQMKNSGVPWLLDIPETWGIRVLFQLADQVKNKNKDLSEQNLLSLSYGRIKRKDINSSDGLLPESFDGYSIIEANDIVLRLTDLQNDHTSLRVGQSHERGIITSAYTTLRPSTLVWPAYLYYVLHAYDLIKGFYGMGSGVRQGLNYDEVKTIKVPLPSLDEQHAIAAYLDDQAAQIESIITEAQSSIEDYKRWKAAIVCEAVTKGMNTNVLYKDSGIDWIGLIPQHWTRIKAGRVIVSTQNGLTRRDLEKSSGTIVLKLKNISANGNIDYSETNRIEMTEKEMSTYALHENDMLFVRVNGSRNLVGKCAIYHETQETVAYNDHIIRTRTTENYNVDFFRYYLLSLPGKCEIELHTSTSAGQFTISGEGLRDLYITLPPYNEQTDIVKYLDDKCRVIDGIIEEKEALIADLESYKRSLIYEAVTGKRKVV